MSVFLVNEEEGDNDAALDCLTETLSKASVGKKKTRRKEPDNHWSGSEDETLKETAQKITEDENRTLRSHKDETVKMKKKTALKKIEAGSSSSSLLEAQSASKKPEAIVSPNKRKSPTEDPENG